MRIAIVVAMGENGVIGRDGGLPWKLSSDLKRFKADTLGKPVIMGRRTWESIGRPLPGRANIVVTRDPDYRAEGVDIAASLDGALRLAETRAGELGADEIAVIGGGEIYGQALAQADRLHVTHVLGAVDGDTFFPRLDLAEWRLLRSEEVPAGPKDSHATRHCVYARERDSSKS